MQDLTKQTYKVYWAHLQRYRGLMWILIAALSGSIVLDVIVPLYYKRFFDVLTSTSSSPSEAVIGSLTSIIVFVLVLHSASWALYRVKDYLNIYLESKVMADLLNTSFEYLHRHSYAFFANRFAGALVRRVNRLADSFEGVFDRVLSDLYPLILRTIIILGVLFYKNLVLGSAMLLWVLVFVAISYVLAVRKLKYDIASAEADTKTTAELADTITNNSTIKLFTGLKDEEKTFKRSTAEQDTARRMAWNFSANVDAVQSVLAFLLEFFIFYYAVRLWRQGLLTVGDFVLIQSYLLLIIYRLWDFGRMVRRLYRHLSEAGEMVEILSMPHEVKDRPGASVLAVPQGKVEFQSVTFAYVAEYEVIRNLSLIIAPGEKVGLVGPSGAGKTTIAGLLFRYHDLTSGRILIDGTDISAVTQESLRKNISLVPQDPILFHRTLMENIRYGRRDATEPEVIAAARMAHCDEFIERLPDQYETYVGERGIKLSGGERQRVAIARAILKNAPILVLDEATSSLDSHSESLIQDALETLMRGKTTIVIAHRLSTIMKMDRIVVLRGGELLESGTHAELLDNAGSLYKQLWQLQAGGFIA